MTKEVKEFKGLLATTWGVHTHECLFSVCQWGISEHPSLSLKPALRGPWALFELLRTGDTFHTFHVKYMTHITSLPFKALSISRFRHFFNGAVIQTVCSIDGLDVARPAAYSLNLESARSGGQSLRLLRAARHAINA